MKKLLNYSNNTFFVFGLLLFMLPFSIPFFNFFNNSTAQTTIGPSITPIVSCIPRPSCLDKPPYCRILEPAEGWCPSTISPYPTSIIPPGCYIKPGVCPMACAPGSACPSCKPTIVCPSGTPTLPIYPHPQSISCSDCSAENKNELCFSPSQKRSYCSSTALQMAQPSDTTCVTCSTVSKCYPRPACLDANPPCQLPIPPGGWCSTTIASSSAVGTFIPTKPLYNYHY